MNNEERLAQAMNLLERAANHIECGAPDKTWWREYFLLTGQHMILTDEGWEPASVREEYERQAAEFGETWSPLDEVNAPEQAEEKGGRK